MSRLPFSLTRLPFTLFLYAVGVSVVALSLFPALVLVFQAWRVLAGLPWVWRIFLLGFALPAGYLVYGLTLLLACGLVRALFRLTPPEGEHDLDSSAALRWVLANCLVLIVSATFLDFILLTPLANLFYRLMGAKVGRNVQINSKCCSDLGLLEIGSGSVIGGHATVIAHSFERGRVILKKVRLGERVIVGLNSVILPGARIGDGATIAAGAVLLKNAVVEPASVYAGVPAVQAKEPYEVSTAKGGAAMLHRVMGLLLLISVLGPRSGFASGAILPAPQPGIVPRTVIHTLADFRDPRALRRQVPRDDREFLLRLRASRIIAISA